MFKTEQLQKLVVFGFVLLFSFQGLAVYGSDSGADDELLQMLPGESLFCVRINNFGQGLQAVDQFMSGMLPMPVSPLVQMQLAQMLGSQEMAGVEMNGDFAVFGALTPGGAAENPLENMFVGILIPVTDYKTFIESNPNCQAADAKGISRMQSIDGVFFGYLKQVGDYALMGPDWMNAPEKTQSNLLAVAQKMSDSQAAKLAGVVDAKDAQAAAEQTVWLFGNIAEANKVFGPMVLQQIDMIKGQIASEMAVAGTSTMGDPVAIIDMYVSIFKGLVNEAKYVSLTVAPKPTAVNLTFNMTAMPDTEFGQMLAGKAVNQRSKRLTGFLENGALMNFEGRIDTPFMKQVLAKSIDLMATLAGEQANPEDLKAMQDQITKVFAAMGNTMVFSLGTSAGSTPPFAVKEVFEVKDAQAYNDAVEQQLEMFKSGPLADMYKNMGMKIDYQLDRAVGEYKGETIDSALMSFKSLDPDTPEAQIIDLMYGDGIRYHWAIVDDLCVYAIAGDSEQLLHELIDQVKSQTAQPVASEMNAALAALSSSQEADFVGTFNVVRLIKMVGLMLEKMEAMGVPPLLPVVSTPSNSNISFAGKVGENKMSLELSLPKSHITEIIMLLGAR
ncbi:MAG: hypothetical protein GY869_31225 [Planctomycetes bacterium]|nr:hypothetical protein [Planctomycetota bacterium]